MADPGCVPVGETQVCGPSKVNRVDIIEFSTTEVLGECSFDNGDTAATQVLKVGYRFWCVRAPDPAGGGTEIRLYSKQANLPGIRAYLVRESDGLPMWQVEVPPAAVLNGPDGTTLSNPYERTDLEFAGFKKLIFTTKQDKDYDFMCKEALYPLRDAGYTANLHSFTATNPGFIADIGVFDTLDGRALIAQEVVEKRGWKVDRAETKGNLGAFEYADSWSVGAIPIFVTDIPFWDEKAVSGYVLVSRNSDGVPDARVKLNGRDVPHWADGLYDVAKADVTGLGPGSEITIEVSHDDLKESLTVTFSCPPPVEFTSPAEGSVIDHEQPLSVSWSPGIPYDAMRIAGGPLLGVYACCSRNDCSQVTAMGHGEGFISLEVGQTSQSLEVLECNRYLLELQYPGERVVREEDGNYLMGLCSVQNRMWLLGAGD